MMKCNVTKKMERQRKRILAKPEHKRSKEEQQLLQELEIKIERYKQEFQRRTATKREKENFDSFMECVMVCLMWILGIAIVYPIGWVCYNFVFMPLSICTDGAGGMAFSTFVFVLVFLYLLLGVLLLLKHTGR